MVKSTEEILNGKLHFLCCVDAFKNNESIQRIKLTNFRSNKVFSFRNITEEEVKKILSLISKKATRIVGISAKRLKEHINVYLKDLII